MANGAPRPSPPSGIAGTIVSIIETVRDWRQLAILVVLSFFGLIGLLVYQARDRIIASVDTFMTSPPPVRLADTVVLQDMADKLYDQLAPDNGVVIWRIDMIHNRRTLAALKLAPAIIEAMPQIKMGRVMPLFSRFQSDANLMTIRVLDGEVPCGEPPREIWERDAIDPAPAATIRDMVKTVCCVGIPPTIDAFVGMIAVGFSKPLDPQREGIVSTTLRTMAEQGTK
jgi:hypothetical protein